MITFKAEHRSNGITYITVDDDGKPAGAFSLSTEDWTNKNIVIENFGDPHQDSPAEPFTKQESESAE